MAIPTMEYPRTVRPQEVEPAREDPLFYRVTTTLGIVMAILCVASIAMMIAAHFFTTIR